MSKKTIVTFVKPWRGYGPDEVAGFDKKEADVLLEKGIAQVYSGKKATAKREQPAAGSAAPATTSTTTADDTNAAAAAAAAAAAGDDSDNDDAKP